MTILSDWPTDPLKLQCEQVEVGSAIGEFDVVFAIVAACTFLSSVAIGPRQQEKRWLVCYSR